MSVAYRRCRYEWEYWHMNEPTDTPPDESPDAFEDYAETDPDPVMNDDAADDYADVPEGVDEGDTDV